MRNLLLIPVLQLQYSSCQISVLCWPLLSRVSMLCMQSAILLYQLNGSVKKTEHLDIFLFFRPSLNGVLFPIFCLLVEGSVTFYCFKILLVNNILKLYIFYSVNILRECLRILIDCSQLSKTYYNVLFTSSTRDHRA